MDPIDLIELRQRLAKAQAAFSVLSTKYQEARAAMEEKFANDNSVLIALLADAREDAVSLETQARNSLHDWYVATGDKKPIDGFGVRVGKSLAYDKTTALKWALEHGGVAVKLDDKAFEKVVQALPEIPEFVTVEDKVTTTISPDLSQYVDDEEAAVAAI